MFVFLNTYFYCSS